MALVFYVVLIGIWKCNHYMLNEGLVNKTKPLPLLIAFIEIFSQRTISTKADVWLGKERCPAGIRTQSSQQEWQERHGCSETGLNLLLEA